MLHSVVLAFETYKSGDPFFVKNVVVHVVDESWWVVKRVFRRNVGSVVHLFIALFICFGKFLD